MVEALKKLPEVQRRALVLHHIADLSVQDVAREDSFAWSRQFRDEGGLVSQLTLVLVARTGNAVYIESSYTAAGGDAVVAAETERLTQHSNVPLQSLCLFAANPCPIES